MAWTDAEVTSFVFAMLGAPQRKVELNPINITEALKVAVRTYASIKPIFRKGSVVINGGVQKYDFIALAKPYGKGLTNIYVQPITSPAAVFNEFEYYRLRQPPYVDMSELLTDRMYYKEIGNLTGTNFDWEWTQSGSTMAILLVSPIPTRTFTAAYDYNLSPSTMAEIPEYDQQWVANYALALCKEILGRVRGKYQGVPGNDLPVTTDWQELLNEGREAQKDLLDTIKGTAGAWATPIVG